MGKIGVKLLLETGPAQTRTVELRSAETVIGRRQGCDLRIPSALVSRRHCILRYTDGLLSIEDLKSVNGTYVNNERLSGTQVLKPGDRLQLGPLTFRIDYKPPVEETSNPFEFGGAGAEEEAIEAELLEEEAIDAEIMDDDEAVEAEVLLEEEEGPTVLEVIEPEEKGVKKKAKSKKVARPAADDLDDLPEVVIDDLEKLELPRDMSMNSLLGKLDK